MGGREWLLRDWRYWMVEGAVLAEAEGSSIFLSVARLRMNFGRGVSPHSSSSKPWFFSHASCRILNMEDCASSLDMACCLKPMRYSRMSSFCFSSDPTSTFASGAAADEARAAGTADEVLFSEMPAWFRWKCILWATKAGLHTVSSEFWSEQAAKSEVAAVELSHRSARHVADGGLVPLEVSVRGEAADAFAADFARELLRAYPNI